VSGTVGINEIDFAVSDMQLYPNPASGDVAITYTLSKRSDVRIEVLDLLGKQVQVVERENRIPGVHLTNLDISTISKGVYFVSLKTENGVVAKRLIVE
jgi:hypothetical protein